MGQWWKSQLSKRPMPKLLIREPTPAHWQGPAGSFVQGGRDQSRCRNVERSAEQADAEAYLAARTEPFRQILSQLPRGAGMVIPIFWAMLDRYDEHPTLHFWAGGIEHATLHYWAKHELPATYRKFSGKFPSMDCTHYCFCSSVHRLLSSVLIAYLADSTESWKRTASNIFHHAVRQEAKAAKAGKKK